MSLAAVGRWAVRGAIAVAALVALLWVRSLAEARLELGRAEHALREGEVQAGVAALGRAVRWTAPLNLYASDALVRMLELAATQARRGEREAARKTYRTARGSLVASAGLVQLHAGTLAEIERELRRLEATAPPAGSPFEPPSRAARRAADRAPFTRLMALGGFALWVAAAFALAALGRRPAARQRLACGVLLLVGLCFFGAGLWLS